MQEEIGSLHKEVNNLNAELRQTKEYIQVLHEQQNKFKNQLHQLQNTLTLQKQPQQRDPSEQISHKTTTTTKTPTKKFSHLPLQFGILINMFEYYVIFDEGTSLPITKDLALTSVSKNQQFAGVRLVSKVRNDVYVHLDVELPLPANAQTMPIVFSFEINDDLTVRTEATYNEVVFDSGLFRYLPKKYSLPSINLLDKIE